MIEHLEASCRELSAVAALATRRTTLETLEMLGQACELLELASEAVEAPPLAALSNRALRAANELLSNLSDQVNTDGRDAPPALAYLEECQTLCAMLLEQCSDSQRAPMSLAPMVHEAMPASNSAATKALDASVLQSLQRHVLGLADKSDQQELNNAGVTEGLAVKDSTSKEFAASLPRRTAGGYLALDQHSALVQDGAFTSRENEGCVGGADDEGATKDSNEESADAPSADALVRLWPSLAATARLKLSGDDSGSYSMSGDYNEHGDQYSNWSPPGGGGSTHQGYAKVAGADAARAVGGLSAALGAVLAGLEEQHRLQRQLQGVRRLPPFARRDALAALTTQLKTLAAARAEACRTLTGLAQSNSLSALLPVHAKQATADALDTLALAWQAARSDELGNSNHRNRSGNNGNTKSNTSSNRSNRGASGGESKPDFGESVRHSARDAVAAAQELLNDHASKRRNGLAASGRPRPAAEDHHNSQQGRSSADNCASSPIDSESVRGAAGDASSFAVHLSKHCEFAPTFSDVAGLSVAVGRPPQASSGSNFLNPRAMYPQKVNNVNPNAAAHKRWVLDHKQQLKQQQGSGGYEPRSSLRASAASTSMALVPGAAQQREHQHKRVQRMSAGRRGMCEGKENGAADQGSSDFDLDGLGLALSASRVVPPSLR